VLNPSSQGIGFLTAHFPKLALLSEQLSAITSQREDDLGQALALANQIPTLWAEADEGGKREVLEAVFTGFVVENKRIVDVEVRAPYNWLMRWSQESD